MGEILVFHHIPKTAGTSLREALEANYAPEQILSPYRGPSVPVAEWYQRFYDDLERERLKEVRVVVAHTAHFLLPVLVEHHRPFRALTLLRDPVSRLDSHFRFTRAAPDPTDRHRSRLAAAIADRSWRLADVFDELSGGDEGSSDLHRVFRTYFNGQVRALAEPHVSVADLAYVEDPGAAGRELLGVAISVLERYYSVGLCEDYEESLRRFAAEFGWRQAPVLRRNVNPSPSDPLDERTRDRVERFNALDRELVAYVRQRFPTGTA